jgi:glycosyltransferase involved in cell wall biosynthesis
MKSGSSRFRLTFLTVIPSPYQRQLFRALDGSGHFDLRVFYYAATARDRQWKNGELASFETILPGTTLHFLGDSAHLNPGVVRVLSRNAAGLVVISDYSAPTAQLAMRYLNAWRSPWVFWGEIPGVQGRGGWGQFVRSQLQGPIKWAAAIAAIGSRAAAAYTALFPRLPVFNIPYFCDLAHYQAAAELAGPDKRTTNVDVLFSGQLIPRKGVDVLVEAFVRSATAAPHMRLFLLGDGPERAQLSGRIPPPLRERVIFLGFRNPQDLPSIFAAADVFVLPSRHDGWGLVVNEALGAGLPIIASDCVGAAHDIVQHGVNGFVTPAEDPGALAEAMTRLAGSAAMRNSFGQASRDLAKNWGLDAAVSRWLQLCGQLLMSKV